MNIFGLIVTNDLVTPEDKINRSKWCLGRFTIIIPFKLHFIANPCNLLFSGGLFWLVLIAPNCIFQGVYVRGAAFSNSNSSDILNLYPTYLEDSMSLNDKTIQSAKCPEDKKATKLFDGSGLYLLVNSSGSKLWRMRFKFAKKRQETVLGKPSAVAP